MSRQSGLRRLPGLFWTVAVFFVAVLIWLGWTTLELDRELSIQRTRERLQRSAMSLAGAFRDVLDSNDVSLGALQDALRSKDWEGAIGPPNALRPGRVFLSFGETEYHVVPEHALRYAPIVPDPPEADPRLVEADRREFAHSDLAGALRLLVPLVEADSLGLRADALLRAARIQKRRGNGDAALAAYDRLGRLSAAYPAGIPAPWLARYARCHLFEESRQYDSLAVEARRLVGLLRRGGYVVDRETYAYYASTSRAWLVASDPDSAARMDFTLPDRHPFSEAALALRDIASGWRRGEEERVGARLVETEEGNVFVQWRATAEGLVGLLMAEDRLRETVAAAAGESAAAVSWFIVDGAGRAVTRGEGSAGTLQASYSDHTAGQTWTVRATDIGDAGASPQERTRRLLLLLGLTAAVALVSVSMYYVSRALRRELEVAQLQSEFVSAVSHEFRTPLTSIRQLTELLRSGRIRSADRTGAYLEVIDREARRLNRLVDSLLNFGRAEAGLHPYDMKPTSISGLVHTTVDEYRLEQEEARPVLVECTDDAMVEVDRPTMSLVIWNLVDNARKYSSREAAITVRTRRHGQSILLSVEDKGIGIAPEDKARIFERFVRVGGDSVPGTGLGLALVKRVVEDHHGAVLVESTPGEGSTFTVRLPIVFGIGES